MPERMYGTSDRLFLCAPPVCMAPLPSLSLRVALSVIVALCTVAPNAGAVPKEGDASNFEMPRHALTIDAPVGADPVQAAPQSKPVAPQPFKLSETRLRLIEIPGEASPFGVKRAHHAIGLRSYWAENWLHEQGIPAHNCLLPMVRMHSRIDPSGNANATLWVYARCSLD